MRARKPRWYSLHQLKIRMSWNKHNLFNLVRKSMPAGRFNRTFFQQKWMAKSAARAYHGPNIKERDWNRMFDRRLYSAVDIDPEYLAKYDGSEQAAGRGSGLIREAGRDERQATGESITAYNYSRSERDRQMRNRANPSLHLIHPMQSRLTQDRKGTLLTKPIYHMTPYMNMAFAPLERRLDVAIFRAMFASSTLQAKQFCTHGAVKVNGKTMRYGAYRLNPGDMFQVDVEKVLYATGRPKTPDHAKFIAGEDAETLKLAQEAKKAKEAEGSEEAAADAPAEADAAAAAEPAVEEAEAEAAKDAEDKAFGELSEEEQVVAHRKHLSALVRSAKHLISDTEGLNPRKKRQLRAFMSETKRAISRAGRHQESANLEHGDVMDHLSALLKDFKLDGSHVEAISSDEGKKQQQQPQEEGQDPKQIKAAEKFKDKAAMATIDQLITSKEVRAKVDFLSKGEQRALADLLRRDAENPIDETKPYWTPWEPRQWIAPFAFIPRYLEVNQNICAAVYLRHPVARRGLAEVPTPFSYETNQLAFNYYLKRR